MKSTFRNLPIRPVDRKWLVMKVMNPQDGKTYYFVDKCLPFGASISCSHFQRVSDSIQHIFKFRSKSDANNYLDDFLFVALLKAICDGHIQTFIELCQEINFPIAMEKTEWGTQIIIFLGMLLNTIMQTISVPVEKKNKALHQLIEVITAKKVQLI